MRKLHLLDLTNHFGKGLKAHVTFDKSNWGKEYAPTARTYEIEIDSNWGLDPSKEGRSIIGNCLDGIDLGVRLDWYQWKIEKIKILENH